MDIRFWPKVFSRDLFYKIFYCDLYFRLDFKTIQNTMELEITIFTVTFFTNLYQNFNILNIDVSFQILQFIFT